MKKMNIKEKEHLLFENINHEISEMVDTKVQSLHKHSGQVDRKSIENECENQFFKELELKLDQGTKSIHELGNILKLDDPSLYEKLSKKMRIISENLSKCKNVKDLYRFTEHAFSPHEIKKIQQLGLKHFENQQLDQAHLYFTFLTIIDSENASLWLAKGMAEQSLEKFEEALVSYSNALTLLPQGIVTYIQIIETLILMKKTEQAHQVYEIFTKEIDHSLYAHDEFLVSKVDGVKEFLGHMVS